MDRESEEKRREEEERRVVYSLPAGREEKRREGLSYSGFKIWLLN